MEASRPRLGRPREIHWAASHRGRMRLCARRCRAAPACWPCPLPPGSLSAATIADQIDSVTGVSARPGAQRATPPRPDVRTSRSRANPSPLRRSCALAPARPDGLPLLSPLREGPVVGRGAPVCSVVALRTPALSPPLQRRGKGVVAMPRIARAAIAPRPRRTPCSCESRNPGPSRPTAHQKTGTTINSVLQRTK